MIARKLAETVRQAATRMPIVTITGPRQSGKSTLARAIFPGYRYVNLEDLEHRRYAQTDPKGFLRDFSAQVVLDEVQYVPDLLSYLQVLADEQGIPGQFILTSSQNLLLMEQVSQSLAGRTAIFHLLPFSLEELNEAGVVLPDYESYLIKGFYPRIYDQNLDPAAWLRDYTLTYVERDVRQLVNIENTEVFRQFVELCAGRVGQMVNFSEFGSILGVSFQTVRRWLSLLQTSFIVHTLRPYYRNYDKRIAKTPKLYFYDTGLACALLNIRTPEQLNQHFAKGALFENFAMNEVLKNYYNRGERPNLYFWRHNERNEVDLIVDKGLQLYPVEIKAGRTIQPVFFDGLRHFNENSGNPPENGFVLYGGSERQQRSAATVLGWPYLGNPALGAPFFP